MLTAESTSSNNNAVFKYTYKYNQKNLVEKMIIENTYQGERDHELLHSYDKKGKRIETRVMTPAGAKIDAYGNEGGTVISTLKYNGNGHLIKPDINNSKVEYNKHFDIIKTHFVSYSEVISKKNICSNMCMIKKEIGKNKQNQKNKNQQNLVITR